MTFSQENLRMYLKFTVDGPLEDLVRSVWPEATEDELIRDYENVYEWVWLKLPAQGLRLNISREHEWGEDVTGTVFPIYVTEFEDGLKRQGDGIARQIASAHGCPVEVHEGRHNVEKPDGKPVRVIE